MKTIVVYKSFHHKNTEKIARVIGSVMGAAVTRPRDASAEDILGADVVGFGSGVYASRFHGELLELVDALPRRPGGKAFLFSTSGVRRNFLFNRAHADFRKRLGRKNFKVIGEFYCPGFDTFGPLKFFGGINRGRPNEKDVEEAGRFARSLLEKMDGGL